MDRIREIRAGVLGGVGVRLVRRPGLRVIIFSRFRAAVIIITVIIVAGNFVGEAINLIHISVDISSKRLVGLDASDFLPEEVNRLED